MNPTVLTLLNQGAETEVGYKKLIAEYLDVPFGKKPHLLLRRAVANIPDSDELRRIFDSDSEHSDDNVADIMFGNDFFGHRARDYSDEDEDGYDDYYDYD
jgi:hypothetical protein